MPRLQKKRKQEEMERKAVEARKQQEAEERRLVEEQRRKDEFAAEQAQMQAARQGQLDSEKKRLMYQIQQKVQNAWRKPTGWPSGTRCKVRVRLVPGAGTAQVIDVRTVTSCGQTLFDQSVESAVYSASPLPFPTAPELAREFREFVLDFNPKD